ncbi:MAG: esterase/lipase family protein [Lachnospiraceae bacterium]
MKWKNYLGGILFFLILNLGFLLHSISVTTAISVLLVIAAVAGFVFLQVCPSLEKYPARRMRLMQNGTLLLQWFVSSVVLETVLFLYLIFGVGVKTYGIKAFVLNLIWVFLAELITFWSGMIRIFISSVQLGIRWRVLAVACGWIPIANVVVLLKMISLVKKEFSFEAEKQGINLERNNEEICHTNYPILLVHGVFFRDFNFFNYWGRIPKELQKNGAQIYYGNQQSAASVADSAKELAERIRQILEETGSEKVNIIAHSKGGLDSRYAISCLGMAPYVASLTTVNTPHTGCIFADYLLEKAPDSLKQSVANTYNSALRKVGDANPDFLEAVNDLTASACQKLNEQMPDVEGVYYQSVGSYMAKAASGRFPLNISYPLVKHFDGKNDGLVALDAMKWGEQFFVVDPPNQRGISHGDMIDLNRENVEGFDVREFYVKLVADLKQRQF